MNLANALDVHGQKMIYANKLSYKKKGDEETTTRCANVSNKQTGDFSDTEDEMLGSPPNRVFSSPYDDDQGKNNSDPVKSGAWRLPSQNGNESRFAIPTVSSQNTSSAYGASKFNGYPPTPSRSSPSASRKVNDEASSLQARSEVNNNDAPTSAVLKNLIDIVDTMTFERDDQRIIHSSLV
jgi:hypothetical protein